MNSVSTILRQKDKVGHGLENPEGSILYLPVAPSGELFQLQSGRCSQNSKLDTNKISADGLDLTQDFSTLFQDVQVTFSGQFATDYLVFVLAFFVTSLVPQCGLNDLSSQSIR